jgi:tetratricopeptide (TPR) repeat protein
MNSFFFIVAALLTIIAAFGYYIFSSKKGGVSDRALSLASMGKFLDAKALVRDRLDQSPSSIELLYLMSKIYGLEGDFDSEQSYLEKIFKLNSYTKDITKELVLSRLGSVTYQKDRYDESFFYYSELIEEKPEHIEANLRLGFMALGQKEFLIAHKFFQQIPKEKMKNINYFIGLGISASMLGDSQDLNYFEKAYQINSKSPVSSFMYSLSLFKNKKYQDALKIANQLVDLVKEQYVKFTIYQFLMVVYIGLNDYSSAMLNAKKCIEISDENDWSEELAESNFFYGVLCLSIGELEKSSEFLIAAESEKPHDLDIINLANFKMDVEENLTNLNSTSPRGFNLKVFLSTLPDRVFPPDRIFEISGMRMQAHINIKSIINQELTKIVPSVENIKPDLIMKFSGLKGSSFKNVCNKILSEMNYKIKRELPCLDSEGANIVAVNKDDETLTCLFRFRKWKNTNLSDFFLTEMLGSMIENNAQIGHVVAFCTLTSGAQRFIKNNEGKINVLSGPELETVLTKIIK